MSVLFPHPICVTFKMAQQQNVPSTSVDYGANLDNRLRELDGVDRKIAELMETTKEIIGNLEKDKQVRSRRFICYVHLDFKEQDGRGCQKILAFSRGRHIQSGQRPIELCKFSAQAVVV